MSTKPVKPAYFGITFTDHDEDLLDWVNMLIVDGQSPRTWIRAILAADELGLPLDAGVVVSVPTPQNEPVKYYTSYFDIQRRKSETGWEKRGVLMGKSREYIIGSILTVNFNDNVIVDFLDRLRENGVQFSPYIKMVIRKYIRVIAKGENVPPRFSDAQRAMTLAKLSSAERQSHQKCSV